MKIKKNESSIWKIMSTEVEDTERKRDEEYIGHLAAIVESSDDAIISKSLNGIIKSWNKAGEKMFGYTAKEAIGNHISMIIPTEYSGEERAILERIYNNEIIAHYETIRNKKSGEQFYVSLTVSPLKDRSGTIIGVCKIARDITAHKESETDLANVHKELVFQNEEKGKRAAELLTANLELIFQNQEKEKRAAELIIANNELAFQNEEKGKRAAELVIANLELSFQNEEKEKRATELIIANKELEQLTYIASHDLQEPLRTISNYMRVFEEDYSNQLDADAYKYIRAVNAAASRMSILVQALLGFSRIGRHKKLVHVDFKELINDVMADLQLVITSSNAIIEVGEMPVLNIYEVEIGQLFQNLISNAIKFQKKNIQPRIRIDAKKIDETWQFSVSDNGIGVDSAYFLRAFDIFKRLHTANEYQGYGIGLANCKKIVELHQGKIWMESTLGIGTIINFNIPHLSL